MNICYHLLYNSSNLCLSVFLDNHWSDIIETCQVYCWGPVDVPFQGLISLFFIRFSCFPSYGHLFTKPMTGHGVMTSQLTSQFFFFFWHVVCCFCLFVVVSGTRFERFFFFACTPRTSIFNDTYSQSKSNISVQQNVIYKFIE